jgi:hypothetical protein
MTAEEMKHARAGYNHRHYVKKVDPYKKIKEDLQSRVTANQMTQEEYERIIREERKKVRVGWYGTARLADDALQQAQQSLAAAQASGNETAIVNVRMEIASLVQSMKHTLRPARQAWKDLASMFPLPDGPDRFDVDRDSLGQIKLDDDGNPIVRFRQNGNGGIEYDGDNGPVRKRPDLITIPTWDQPSRADFLTLLSLFLPMIKWVDNSMLSSNVHHVQRILSNDEKHAETNPIDSYFPESEKYRIYKTFNSSWDEVKKFLDTADAGEREAFKHEWALQMGRVKDTFLPRSHSHPR